MALEGLSRGIFRSIGLLKSKRKLDDEEFDEFLSDLPNAGVSCDNTMALKKRLEQLIASANKRQRRV